MTSRYAALSRDELARLVPELLLIGHLIDRSGMAWCIEALGREGMAEVAIDEWMAASPIYTRRMQRALRLCRLRQASDVVTIFKGLQLDIGAPPQFMDFRYTVHDPWHGEFRLDHCGALMDVEPMGEEYVVSMCHDIEDPTFDATAVATNPRAQVRPVHRPPAGAGRPAPALRVDGGDRRVDTRRWRSPRDAVSSGARWRPASTWTRSTRRTRGRPTMRGRCCRTWTSAPSRTRRWCGWPTRCACRCTCSTWVSATAWPGGCLTRTCSGSRARQLIGIAGLAADRLRVRTCRTAVTGLRGRAYTRAQLRGVRLRRVRRTPWASRVPAHEDGPGSLGATRVAWRRCRPSRPSTRTSRSRSGINRLDCAWSAATLSPSPTRWP